MKKVICFIGIAILIIIVGCKNDTDCSNGCQTDIPKDFQWSNFCNKCVDDGFYPEDNDECSKRCECLERREYNTSDYQQTCIVYVNNSYKGMYPSKVINSTCFNTTQYYDYSLGSCLKARERP